MEETKRDLESNDSKRSGKTVSTVGCTLDRQTAEHFERRDDKDPGTSLNKDERIIKHMERKLKIPRRQHGQCDP